MYWFISISGIYTPLTIAVLVDLVGDNDLIFAFPLSNTSIGVAVLFATPLCGKFRITKHGTYHINREVSADLKIIVFFYYAEMIQIQNIRY